MGKKFVDGTFERGRELLAQDGKDVLGREDAEDEIPGVGEFEHLLDVENEMVEPAFAHQAGRKQQLAAGAPQVRHGKAGDLLAEAELERGTGVAFIIIERFAELRRRRREARFDAGDLVQTQFSGQGGVRLRIGEDFP